MTQHTLHEYVKELYKAFGVSARGELLSRFIWDPIEPGEELSAKDADPQVAYCVNLLTQRGFIVRYAIAAQALVNERRGLASVLAVLALGLLMSAGSLYWLTTGDEEPTAGTGIEWYSNQFPMDLPETTFEIAPRPDPEWQPLRMVYTGSRLRWTAPWRSSGLSRMELCVCWTRGRNSPSNRV